MQSNDRSHRCNKVILLQEKVHVNCIFCGIIMCFHWSFSFSKKKSESHYKIKYCPEFNIMRFFQWPVRLSSSLWPDICTARSSTVRWFSDMPQIWLADSGPCTVEAAPRPDSLMPVPFLHSAPAPSEERCIWKTTWQHDTDGFFTVW